VLGAVRGGLKFEEAQTSMQMADTRSGIQVAAVEGSAKQTDWGLDGTIFSDSGGAAFGAYTNTNEGKVITASFLDNWNNIVRAVRSKPSLIQAKASSASQSNVGGSVSARSGDAGDVMVAKVADVKVLKAPSDDAPVLMKLGDGDEVLYLGEEKHGYAKVKSPKGEGWVREELLRRP
jgi:hypothetical protein